MALILFAEVFSMHVEANVRGAAREVLRESGYPALFFQRVPSITSDFVNTGTRATKRELRQKHQQQSDDSRNL